MSLILELVYFLRNFLYLIVVIKIFPVAFAVQVFKDWTPFLSMKRSQCWYPFHLKAYLVYFLLTLVGLGWYGWKNLPIFLLIFRLQNLKEQLKIWTVFAVFCAHVSISILLYQSIYYNSYIHVLLIVVFLACYIASLSAKKYY